MAEFTARATLVVVFAMVAMGSRSSASDDVIRNDSLSFSLARFRIQTRACNNVEDRGTLDRFVAHQGSPEFCCDCFESAPASKRPEVRR